MKKIIILLILTVLFCVGCTAECEDAMTYRTNEIEALILNNLKCELGYCDVSEYYLENYFNNISGMKSGKIYTCNESTNFDEFGIFEFESVKDAQTAKSAVKKYLSSAKEEFKSGIVYNANEFPKFEAARVEIIGNYAVYTILDKEISERIFSEIKNMQ